MIKQRQKKSQWWRQKESEMLRLHKVFSQPAAQLPVSISILVCPTFVHFSPPFPLELHNDLYTYSASMCVCVSVGIYCALINQIAQLTACGTWIVSNKPNLLITSWTISYLQFVVIVVVAWLFWIVQIKAEIAL